MKPSNLNFLRMFDAVMRTRSVSRAADELGVTQPALSNALARLRTELGDALIVRGRSGIEPTPFALSYHRSVASALALLDNAGEQASAFDPDTTTHSFTIAMSDIAEAVILSRVVSQHFRNRRNLSLTTRPVPSSEIAVALERGSIDLAIGFVEGLRGPLIRQTLFRTDYVCLAPKGLEFSKQQRFVMVDGEGTGHALATQAISKAYGPGAVAVLVPHFLSVPYVVRASGLPAIVPRPLVSLLKDWPDLEMADAPCPLPQVDIISLAHTRVRTDPANMWLRDSFRTTFAGVDWSDPSALKS